jgi:hypothetical protein
LPLFLCCLSLWRPAAAEILDLQVHRTANRFDVSFEVSLQAPPDEIRLLLHRPELWPRLSSVIESSRVEAREGGRLASMVFRECILWWCAHIRKTSVFRDLPSGDIVGIAVPERSDFQYARERWRVLPDPQGTRLLLNAELVPSFRVPPLVGSLLARAVLRKLLDEMEHNVESGAVSLERMGLSLDRKSSRR